MHTIFSDISHIEHVLGTGVIPVTVVGDEDLQELIGVASCPGVPLVLAGTSALSLWNIEEEELIAKYVGHPVRILSLTCTCLR